MSRRFYLEIKNKDTIFFTSIKQAETHRNAAMLAVSEYDLDETLEVRVSELLPSSTYRIYKHTSYEIEQAC